MGILVEEKILGKNVYIYIYFINNIISVSVYLSIHICLSSSRNTQMKRMQEGISKLTIDKGVGIIQGKRKRYCEIPSAVPPLDSG